MKRRRVGYTYLRCAVDDHSRVAYVEAHDNEQAETLTEFWQRAQDWFWARGMAVDDLMSDNGSNFQSRVFAELLAEQAIKHRRTQPYRPQANGKVERFNRTMADEFLYSFTFRSENQRHGRLDRWVHDYNHTATTPRSAAHPHHAYTTSVAPTPRPTRPTPSAQAVLPAEPEVSASQARPVIPRHLTIPQLLEDSAYSVRLTGCTNMR